MSINEFMPVLTNILSEIDLDNKTINKIANGLSVMNKNAVIQREIKGKNKGKIISFISPNKYFSGKYKNSSPLLKL